jgi:hypothetical protein
VLPEEERQRRNTKIIADVTLEKAKDKIALIGLILLISSSTG